MENTNTQITDNDFLLELEGLIDTPKTEKFSETEIKLNEKIEVSPSDNLDDIFSEIHEEVNSNENISCSKADVILLEGEQENIIASEVEISEVKENSSIEKNIESESIQITETKKEKSKILSGIFFGVRYMLTTSLIFGVLLVTMNYQAYYNIAMSYINVEDLQNQSRGLISSVEASNITEKFQDEIIQQKSFIEEDREEIKSKNSVKNLLEISEKN
jgi:hypothetical protein